MRNLILQTQISLDGFMAGEKNEMDWMVWDWDQELKNDVQLITKKVDTILLGRNLAEGFIDHWKSVSVDKTNPERDSGIEFTNMKKIVFSKKLSSSKWDNTTVINSDAKEHIKKLKKEEGKDLIAYGGVEFVNYLIVNNLIDLYYLFINPTSIGKGKSIFLNRDNYKITNSKLYECGIQGMVLKKT